MSTTRATDRPRRSVLYMPGSSPRAMEKGRGLPVDALIFDLEDAVAPDAKASAREAVVRAVAAGGYGRRERIVRVNGLETPWGVEDVAAAVRAGADAVLLPKVESPETVHEAERLVTGAAGPGPAPALMCMIETPRGVLRVREIAEAGGRLACLVMGTSDLTVDLRASHTPDRLPLLGSLHLSLLAARAACIAILDGVHLDITDAAGLAAACRQGADLGFDGKTLIHPSQIAAANAAFSPSPERLAWSRRVVAALAEAEQQGRGTVLLDGRLVESLHVREARRLLALAEARGAGGESPPGAGGAG